MTNSLIEGFQDFRREHYKGEDPLMPRLVEEGQSPEYFIISCIDSRSNPATMFRAEPGTFFAHKAMGAIVRPYKKGTALSASLQFALIHNKVTEIVIMGHTGCGAIKALIDKIEDEEIASFIEVAQVGLEKAKISCGSSCTRDSLQRFTEEQIVLESKKNLYTYPSVIAALAENRVRLRAWIFDMQKGQILEHNDETNSFVVISQKTAPEQPKEQHA